jgi:hypothetical protein
MRPLLDPRTDDTSTPLVVVLVAASLAVAVCIIHLQDQGGLLGDQSPTWLKFGYYLIEIFSLIAAGWLVRGKTIGWVVGLGCAALPFIGYVLSRSVGLPGDSGDIGNWGYMLGTVSLLVEGTFALVAVACLVACYRMQTHRLTQAPSRIAAQRASAA